MDYSLDNYTKLLLHCNGADTSTTFTDASNSQRGNATVSGSAQVDTAVKQFGTGSLMLNGSTDYLSFSDSDDFDFGGDPFTIDFWARFTGGTGSCGICGGYEDASNRWILWINPDDDTATLYVRVGGIAVVRVDWTSLAITTDTLYHFALVRESDDYFYLYKNGVEQTGTEQDTSGMPPAPFDATFEIGRGEAGGTYYYMNGYIDEFRLTKGVARWTADFSADLPTQEYDSYSAGGTPTRFMTTNKGIW